MANYLESADVIRHLILQRTQEEKSHYEKIAAYCEQQAKNLKIDLGPFEKKSNLRAVLAGRRPQTFRPFTYTKDNLKTYVREKKELMKLIDNLRELAGYYQDNPAQIGYVSICIEFCAAILAHMTSTNYADVESVGFISDPQNPIDLEKPVSKVNV